MPCACADDARSERRRIARGSPRPRPPRECSRRPPPVRCGGDSVRRSRRQGFAIVWSRRSIAVLTPASIPSERYSRGKPIRMPLIGLLELRRHSRSLASRLEVESSGSWPASDIHQHGRVAHRFRQRPDLVERRCERGYAKTRYAPIARLQTNDSAESSRLPDGASGVRAERAERFIRGHGCCGTPARTAGHARYDPTDSASA